MKCFVLHLTAEAGWYQPAGRRGHSTAVVGQRLFLWAGNQEKAPRVHDTAEKRAFLSRVDVFHIQSGSWEQKSTSGTPPLGTWGYACAAVDCDLHYFGGVCGHDVCRHNSVHRLSTSSLQWKMLAATTTEGRRPMKKSFCGMVAFKDGEEDFLFVVGGMATTASSKQLGAQYVQRDRYLFTNEQHMFSMKTSE